RRDGARHGELDGRAERVADGEPDQRAARPVQFGLCHEPPPVVIGRRRKAIRRATRVRRPSEVVCGCRDPQATSLIFRCTMTVHYHSATLLLLRLLPSPSAGSAPLPVPTRRSRPTAMASSYLQESSKYDR